METENCFHISLTGQIKSCYFPSGFDGHKLFCRYDIVAGADWDLISGMSSGVTQLSRAGSRIEEIVFNMPLEVMYKSTNPFGCKCNAEEVIQNKIYDCVVISQGHKSSFACMEIISGERKHRKDMLDAIYQLPVERSGRQYFK